jgi:uncharacterized repeat protein (TIGR01451 family)
MRLTLLHLGLALAGVLVLAIGDFPCTAVANGALSVSVKRRDLRPLPGVTLQLAGAVNLQGVTDDNGRAEILGLPPAGVVTITPSRSGFRFEPPQLTIPDPANPPAALFTAFPTATDLALSIASDDATRLVGGLINGVFTLSMTINPATAKAGETLPVRLTIRNDGPHEATQVVIRSYLPPGASLVQTTNLSGLTS